MGWKSTIEINREEAIRLISKSLDTLDNLNNNDLLEILEKLGYGEKFGLEYYGYNFIIVEDKNVEDEE